MDIQTFLLGRLNDLTSVQSTDVATPPTPQLISFTFLVADQEATQVPLPDMNPYIDACAFRHGMFRWIAQSKVDAMPAGETLLKVLNFGP